MEDARQSENCSNGWETCPPDILMMIFVRLDPNSLLSCMFVNEWWRDIVDYTAKHNNSWPELAQEAMVSRGVTFRGKSSPAVGWRDLYLNSRRWANVAHAEVLWDYLDNIDDIQYIHVYKDILIVVHGPDLTIRYYDIETSEVLRVVTTSPDVQDEENAEIEINLSGTTAGKKVRPNKCDRMMRKLIKEGPIRRLIVIDDENFFMLDKKNVLRFFKWDGLENKWIDHTLARYFGCNKSICDIHLHNKDVYMLLKTGMVMQLDREKRNFEAEGRRYEYPWSRFIHYSRMLDTHMLLTRIDKVQDIVLPEYSDGRKVMFNKFSVIVSVPMDKQFKVSCTEGTDDILIECPGLTCATQHGFILFLGFSDGRVDICIPNKLLNNGGLPEVSVNIREYRNYASGDDPAVIGLDVHETMESHYLFIATRSHIYKMMIVYPGYIKFMLGIDC